MKNQSSALTVASTSTAGAELQQGEFNKSQIGLIRDQICADLNQPEFELFLAVSQRVGLNPLARQIYAIKRKGKVTHQTSIDGYRLIAERTGNYAGQVGPEWCGADGAWVDVWLKKGPPAAARLGVLRRGFDKPLWGVARFDSYVQTKYDGSPTAMWQRMPDHMLAKCAEANALRRAFPDALSGIYTHEEMGQAESFDDDAVLSGEVVVESVDVERGAIEDEEALAIADRVDRELLGRLLEVKTARELRGVWELRRQSGSETPRADAAILSTILGVMKSANSSDDLGELWEFFKALPAELKTDDAKAAFAKAGKAARKRIGGAS